MRNTVFASKPIFIVASERSGTNLIRRRITESQDIYFGPAPLHLLNHFYYRQQLYGDLSDDANFYRLANDCLGMAYAHFAPWDILLETGKILDIYDELMPSGRTVVGLMHVVNTLYVQKKGYESYICKDNNLFDYIYDISLQIPDARFVFLYRDVRDVVASQRKRPTQRKSVWFLADLWKKEQTAIIQAMQNAALGQRGRIVSYEALISSESDVMDSLLCWLGVSRSESQTALYAGERTDIQEWKNLDQPTMTDNKGKYIQQLSRSQIKIIESVASDQMRILGYQLDTDARKASRRRVSIGLLLAKIRHWIKVKVKPPQLTEGQRSRRQYISQLPNGL